MEWSEPDSTQTDLTGRQTPRLSLRTNRRGCFFIKASFESFDQLLLCPNGLGVRHVG